MGVTIAPPRAPPVPAEYLGRARELRARLIAASDQCSAAIDAAAARALRRHHRSAVPRPDDLVDLARAWRHQLPASGRLDLSITLDRHARSLRAEPDGGVVAPGRPLGLQTFCDTFDSRSEPQ